MSPESLQIAVLVATGAILVVVPLLILWLGARIRNAAHDSTHAALAQSARQHEAALGEFARQYDQSLAELTRRHEWALAEYARQHERAVDALAAEHQRIAHEFGVFSQKRHEAYARLYARYVAATRDLGAALTDHEPAFDKFSRDDLVRYLKAHDIRQKDASDAVAAMDRGDLFAMKKLMTRLHWRAVMRDASVAFQRARDFEALHEIYLADNVRDAVAKVRSNLEALASWLMRELDQSDQAKRVAKQDELQSSIASLLRAMREDLRGGTDLRPKPRAEIDRTPSRNTLPGRTQLADKAAM